MSDADIEALYDNISETTVVGLNYYADELNRRAYERAAFAALAEAKASRRLAVWNMVVALVAVVVAVVAIFVQV
ncbi:hypothetical protein [Saccharopolyspora spinosa]|nr:hypothetical protein [Saccharopolyspora spinosa]